MISDVLSDAISEIERYLREAPGTYASQRDRLVVLVEQMDAVRGELDAPPPQPADQRRTR